MDSGVLVKLFRTFLFLFVSAAFVADSLLAADMTQLEWRESVVEARVILPTIQNAALRTQLEYYFANEDKPDELRSF